MNLPLSARTRWPKRPVHGVLLLDKPLGLSSHDALQKVRRLLRAEKAGHAGTLDPMAAGLLPLCFGAATKFSQAGLNADKTYRAFVTLGQTTSTGDLEGHVLKERPVHVSREQFDHTLTQFIGEIDQMPPMYSALKHEGQALYVYARSGICVERSARRVQIHRIDLLQGQGADWVLDITCSKGTYIRTLVEDIGEALGCGAHLAGLRRLSHGFLSLDQAYTLEHLAELSELERDALLQGPDFLLTHWPVHRLNNADAARFLRGLRRRVVAPDTSHVRVYGPETQAFLGSAHITAGDLIPDRLLSSLEVSALLSQSVSSLAVSSTS